MSRTEPTAVFLDRDGTINVKAPEGAYVTRPEQVELLPGAASAIRRLNDAAVPVVVVTNQRGIARGLMSETDYEAVTAELTARLAAEGASVEAVFHCPHEIGACRCRKPATGLLDRAWATMPALDLTDAAMVGDSSIDVEMGRRAGLRTVLLADQRPARTDADHVVPSLADAVDLLLGGD